MEGLRQEVFELMKDRETKSLVSGRVAKSGKSGRSRNARSNCGFESIDDYASRVVDDTRSIR